MNMFYTRRPFSSSSSSFSSSSCSSKNHSLQTLLKRGFTPTLKSINIFLLSLLRHRKFNLIIHLFTTATLIPTNPTTHSILTWALLHSRSFQDAENLILTHFTHSHPRIWDTLIRTHHDPHRALFLLRYCLQNGGVLPSPLTFSSLIHRLSSQGDLGMTMEVLEIMTDHRVRYPFDDFVCSSVISGFCRIGKPELALGFYDNAVGSGALLRPGLVTLTAIVGALVRLGRLDEVCGMVRRMEEDGIGLDVVLYSVWVCGYVKGNDLVEVFRKMREMVVVKGIDHDYVSYTILIDGFSKLGDVEKSFGILAKMIKEGKRPNKVTYTAIISAYCKKGKFEEARGVFERIGELGIELDEFVYAVLIDGYCRIGDFGSVFKLFVEMEKRGVSPSVVTYNTIINGLCKFGRTSEADELSKDVAADVITYSTLLHGYTEEENTPGILQTKRRLEEAGIAMDIIMCNVLIKALFMMGAFEDVYALYKGMPEMGLVPNSVTYCTMIDQYCKVGRIDEALVMFDDFRKTSFSSPVCYTSIIHGLCKKGMVEMAIEALVELNDKGLELSRYTFRMLMRTILTEKGAKEVLDLVYTMEGLGQDSYESVCNDAIFLLCRRGFLEDAYRLCLMMRKTGLYVTRNSYYSILRSYLSNRNREHMLPLLNIFLKEYGLVDPMMRRILACYLCLKDIHSALQFMENPITLPVSILRILIKEGRALDAYKLVVKTQDSLQVMYADYANLIDALCKGGYLNKALDLCAFVEKKGITLDIVVYNSIINGLCHEGRLIEAFRLFDSLEKLNLIPSEITYATLIYALSREGYLVDAEHVFSKMVLKGFQPKTQVYNSLLEGISKFGQLENALELLNDMETKYIEPDSLTVSAVINCHCQKGNMEGALQFYYEFKRKDVSPDFFGFLYLIRGLCSKGRMEEARSVLREMLKSKNIEEIINIVNNEVDNESIGGFLAILCEQGSIQEALTVLNEIASTLYPVLRLSTYNQGAHAQRNISELNAGLQSSRPLSSSCRTGLDFGSCDASVESDLTINNDSHVTRSRPLNFDFYYSMIATHCAKGELQKANQVAKGMLSHLSR
ncbi:hypothetical protein HN51_053039 [Arachis hypogaea]|uniref:pentatricopeptide repeat-containing protein At5g57250, mitochondrial-like n=1 Tax=Arachis ipaensis TaxID=130454 RepID=UPI0007AF98C2|nr:pentatricopeptide repeat-containing protein At5g57250, mitochondrial-like [Arachis ipaensis]XP_016163914.1 pentatricopeptide repeat-containing protein At5g57250, mitochondrial-like [Arachis ipaensis]XP_016163916.1 pentatricopeptide repeat-containing protein At5g57250, mitochondrial-like [Arachis ipaensis]XP_020962295.1 pentatricopeptide repeat-containing protein At5g57250, mitochondrial-like [Arachis ipaensis]XP_025665867.1 pentatricopeptide repeat-containing protein At5g57250, mitochondrial